MNGSQPRAWAFAALALTICCDAFAMQNPSAAAKDDVPQPAHAHAPGQRHRLRQRGKASIYSRKLAHKPMADGTPLDLNADVAASKQLPLGSKAKVTNLRNGKSAEVEIKDRGPYVPGRIIDLSPKAAAKLGFRDGVAPVEVTPEGGAGSPAQQVADAPAPHRMQGPQP